jgi:hypothetical protein
MSREDLIAGPWRSLIAADMGQIPHDAEPDWVRANTHAQHARSMHIWLEFQPDADPPTPYSLWQFVGHRLVADQVRLRPWFRELSPLYGPRKLEPPITTIPAFELQLHGLLLPNPEGQLYEIVNHPPT